MIIFHGLEPRLSKTWERYRPGVLVQFNETAHMNDTLFIYSCQQYVIHILTSVLDLCSSRKTQSVLDLPQSYFYDSCSL